MKIKNPYWEITRYFKRCINCGRDIFKGSNSYYEPARKASYCLACGKDKELEK